MMEIIKDFIGISNITRQIFVKLRPLIIARSKNFINFLYCVVYKATLMDKLDILMVMLNFILLKNIMFSIIFEFFNLALRC